MFVKKKKILCSIIPKQSDVKNEIEKINDSIQPELKKTIRDIGHKVELTS